MALPMRCVRSVKHFYLRTLTYSVFRRYSRELKHVNDAFYLKTTYARCYSRNRYTETVLLPKSSFPVRVSGEERTAKDQQLQENGNFSELYSWQNDAMCSAKEFCIHDGPPYANGKPHLGHAINKILKDITNRHKLMQGFRIHYIPGWDCHGLPIEIKAQKSLNVAKELPLELRNNSKQFAEQAISIQKQEFEKWAIMADWSSSYYTFTPEYISTEIKAFYELYKKGFVFRDYKPVFWSPYSRTALAEAELDYDNNFKSPAVYVKFRLMNVPKKLQSIGNVYAVIWTTTPWTLPANKAICYNALEEYSVITLDEIPDNLVVATSMLSHLKSIIGKDFSVQLTIDGEDLHEATYQNVFCPSQELPFINSNHVTMDKGTGLVHTAPSHGHDDHNIGLKHHLPNDCNVDESGKYTMEAGMELAGKFVLTEGNEYVLQKLKNDIIHQHSYTHSYPLDWRTKKPVIIRASKQWFINTDLMKSAAKNCLADVDVYPKSFKDTLLSQLESRPFWCISRQRKWGVPIPVFFNEKEEPVINECIIKYLTEMLLTHGSDFWWKLSEDELFPRKLRDELGTNHDTKYVKGEDILDIWFDSGISWKAVLGDERRADYYIEGVDQIRGWFQSSLLTQSGIKNSAPYKNIYIHGFALDEKGRKMSKSLGNVVDPSVITNGGKNKNKNPAYGVDVLRWWVAKHATGRMDINVGPVVLKDSHDNVQKLRLIFKFILGALNEFHYAEHHIERDAMNVTDRYMLHQIHDFLLQMKKHYDGFLYHKAAQEVLNFVTSDVSGFYCHIIKDRLYCDAEDSITRRSCQTVLHHLLHCITCSVAPILPHLAEEIRQFCPFEMESIFKTGWMSCDEKWSDTHILHVMNTILEIRSGLNKQIQSNPREFDVHINATDKLFGFLQMFQTNSSSENSSLCEILQVSSVVLSNMPLKDLQENSDAFRMKIDGFQDDCYTMKLLSAGRQLCGRCRKYTAVKGTEPCERCLDVMGQQWR